MKVLTKELILESNGRRVTYHNITEQVKAFVEETGVKNGLCLVQSQHTTCSVIFEELCMILILMGMTIFRSI